MPYDGDVQDFKTTFNRDGTASRAVDPQVRQDLEATRALLAQGWCQGQSRKWDVVRMVQSYCLIGALSEATFEGYTPGRYANCVEPLRNHIGSGFFVEWNDAPERTQAEVLQVFDAILGED